MPQSHLTSTDHLHRSFANNAQDFASRLRRPLNGSIWSGRRESNPRPTAWKAVTLPLSYSRLKPALSRQLSAKTAAEAALHFDSDGMAEAMPFPNRSTRSALVSGADDQD